MNEPEDRDLTDIVQRLEAERPVPRAAFRGDLRRRLIGMRPSRRRAARQRVGVLIGAYAASGTALLAVAAIGLAGVGPLAS
jgi:hypothetical protein